MNNRGRAALESVDDQMIGLMRVTLALSAALTIYIDPSEPDRFVALTYIALVVYAVYSIAIYFLSVYWPTLLPSSIASWIDIGCYLVLVSLSSGTSSIFFFYFFFSVLVASFRGGFRPGISAAVASSVLFTIIGYFTAPSGTDFELNRFLLRPVYLLVIGYMMAYWGGREMKLKQRLSLLREITNLSNPRFGVSYTIGSMLQKIRAFHDADTCLLVLVDPVYKDTRVFRIGADQAPESVRSERLPEMFEDLLLSFPDNIAIVHKDRSHSRTGKSVCYAFDLTTQKKDQRDWEDACDSVASKLDLGGFVTVPLRYRGKMSGRLYLTAGERTFGVADVDFLMQVVEQIMPVIHNIRLLAQRAFNAAEEERQRLARDLHDSVIQPYIGLQYRLSAIRNKSAEGKSTSEDIERLFQVTVNEIGSLRGFVRGLKEGQKPEANLIPAIRRLAAQFAENYDLEVQVESDAELDVGDRLSPQVILIVQEGLSNVRKHTEASICRITLHRADSNLILSIDNNNSPENGGGTPEFIPRSISERAEHLGGQVRVEGNLDGHTIVKVEIPL